MNMLRCPGCNARIKSSREVRAGESVTCPRCREPFTPVNESVDEEVYLEESTESRDYKVPVLIAGVIVLGMSLFGLVFGIVLTQENRVPQSVAQGPSPSESRSTTEKEKPVPDPSSKADQERKRRDFTRLMAEGLAAMKLEDYRSAAASFSKALELYPDDEDCIELLANARTELAVLERASDDERKRKAEFERLMAEGQTALTAGSLLQAVRAFEEALLLLPGDKNAQGSLREAKDALASQETDRKKMELYTTHVANAKRAFDAGRFEDAVREYNEALAVLPGDAAATKGRRDAEKRIEEKSDEDRKRKSFEGLLADGNKALQERRFDDAITAFQNALQLVNDPAAQRGLQTARKAMADAKRDFDQRMKMGETAMKAGRLEEARRYFKDAVTLLPTEESAQKALQEAETKLQDYKTTREAYDRLMFEGNNALRNRDYALAVQKFQEVLRILPNDAEAKQNLARAKKDLDDFLKAKADYDKFMRDAATLYQQRRYAEAAQAAQSALKIAPDDRAAKLRLDAIQFDRYMADGAAAMAQRKFADAANAFEEALKLRPNDALAKAQFAAAKASIK